MCCEARASLPPQRGNDARHQANKANGWRFVFSMTGG
jgi:hypothetical protein